jgi:hypothetical protein
MAALTVAEVKRALASVGLPTSLISRLLLPGPPPGALYGHGYAVVCDRLVAAGLPRSLASRLAWESFRSPT